MSDHAAELAESASLRRQTDALRRALADLDRQIAAPSTAPPIGDARSTRECPCPSPSALMALPSVGEEELHLDRPVTASAPDQQAACFRAYV